MKNLIIIIFSFLFTQFTFGQSEDLLFIPEVGESSVKLRWAPLDYNDWETALNTGFSLSRYTLIDAGDTLNYDERLNSVIEFGNNILPKLETNWDQEVGTDYFSAAAKSLLYDPDIQPTFSSASLANAVTLQQNSDTRFIFSMLFASRSFDVAKGMALGFEDETAKAGDTYVYTIQINQSESKKSIRIKAGTPTTYDPVLNLEALAVPNNINLKWTSKGLTSWYNFFHIERSYDGVNFVDITPEGYLHSDNNTDGLVYFTDSIPDNTQIYFYRVRGETSFGSFSPYSDIVEIQAIPPRLDIKLLPYVKLETESKTQIKWNNKGLPSSANASIDFFDIHRSLKPDEGYIKLNNNPLPSYRRGFSDINYLPSAYYTITAIDVYGRYYKSRPILVQRQDSIPPGIPEGLVVVPIQTGQIDLNWNAEGSEDLAGYRIFRSNFRNGEYLDVGGVTIKTTDFSDQVSPLLIADSIYYKILSTDKHGNYSDYSNTVGVPRPDQVPPTAPVLFALHPTPDGINIKWGLSESDDLERHILQRKPLSQSGWTDILEIESEDEYPLFGGGFESYHFIDTTELLPWTYVYRLLAYDDNDNVSSSDLTNVQPIVSYSNGHIVAFQGRMYCNYSNDPTLLANYNQLNTAIATVSGSQNPTVANQTLGSLLAQGVINYNQFTQLSQSQGNQLVAGLNVIQSNIAELQQEKYCDIELKWEFKTYDSVEFKIFRGKRPDATQLYRYISAEELEIGLGEYRFLDEEIKKKGYYYYKVLAVFPDGTTSVMSDVVSMNL